MVPSVVSPLLLLLLAPLSLALDISQCIAPLGVESGLIPDKDLSASSSFNDGNVGPQNGRLNQEIKGGAWCPASQITAESLEWLEVELGGVHVVTAAGTQGRFGNGQGQEYAEAYVLEYWRPKLAKWVRYRTADGNEVLAGNTNTYLEKKNQLEPPIWAQKVRFIPHSSHRRTVCMRVELYGCYWSEGIVSYSMPRGHRRSNGVELSDAVYDGAWGEELRGGLGQLVDGRYGGDEIREAARRSAWVGWRNDSLHGASPHITFEFDRVREFSAVHLYCNNRFMRDVQVFSEAVVSFSVGGRQFQPEPVVFAPEPDLIFESSRNVSIQLHHRIGKWVRLQLRFAARWILISEVVFDSDVAQGNYTTESVKPAAGGKEKARVGGGGVAGVGAGVGGEARGAEDPVLVAVGVGVCAALGVLLGGAALLLLRRHRRRKCAASPPPGKPPPDSYSRCATSLLPASKPAAELKPDDYQEPYHSLKCAPYFSYSTVLLEMKDFAQDSNPALSDSSNYEYAVPELSSAPLLSRRRPPSPPPPPASPPATPSPPASPHPPAADRDYAASSLRSKQSLRCGGEGGRGDELSELQRRLHSTSVAEFPRHRLRMISKLAEGAFGTVYVAEADGVPEYDGAVTPDKRLVAVKFLCHDATPAEREQFERDVRVLAALSCERLARVVGACRAPPLAVVLEYLERGDLCALLRQAAHAPPLHTLLHVAAQIAQGMRYLESLNFVHRDLAARNILVGKNYEIKISDFGTDNEAYSGDYWRCAGRVPLPLRWAAWESALLARYSTKSDVWAFGVTVWEVFSLCRRRPHEALSELQLLERLRRLQAGAADWEELPRPALAPRDLYAAMRDCWRRDEARRPTFAALHDFLQRRLASTTPALAPPT